LVCLHCIHLSLFKDFSELFERLTVEEQNEVNNCFNARGPRYFWPLFLQLACHLKLSIYHVSLTERLFSHTSSKVLVLHEPSNIEISKEKFQCLRRGRWLNDEVINLYLELLKEREKREPKRFLKCHFFNTFFYKKVRL